MQCRVWRWSGEYGGWLVAVLQWAARRLQTACREKLMNTAALQRGPIMVEHSCHVTGSPPMRGPQWLCNCPKQSGHMQPLASAARCQHSAFCCQISPSSLRSPARHGPTQLTRGYQEYIHSRIMHTCWSGWPCLIYPFPWPSLFWFGTSSVDLDK